MPRRLLKLGLVIVALGLCVWLASWFGIELVPVLEVSGILLGAGLAIGSVLYVVVRIEAAGFERRRGELAAALGAVRGAYDVAVDLHQSSTGQIHTGPARGLRGVYRGLELVLRGPGTNGDGTLAVRGDELAIEGGLSAPRDPRALIDALNACKTTAIVRGGAARAIIDVPRNATGRSRAIALVDALATYLAERSGPASTAWRRPDSAV